MEVIGGRARLGRSAVEQRALLAKMGGSIKFIYLDRAWRFCTASSHPACITHPRLVPRTGASKKLTILRPPEMWPWKSGTLT